MIGKRDYKIEEILQNAIDEGHRVFAIGDVHGHFEMLLDLVADLELTEYDHVVLLGDLVDRGPQSREVIDWAMKNSNVHAIKGNHEAAMLKHCDPYRFDRPSLGMMSGWYYVGGKDTAESYMRFHMKEDTTTDMLSMKKEVGRHLAYLDSLPDHIVLDHWRLVHAGYDPISEIPLDEQSTDVLHWIREPFINGMRIIDPVRTVVFGHTPTFTQGDNKQGDLLLAPQCLDDGRPVSIGIDTCAYGGDDPQLCAIQLFDPHAE